MPTIINGTTDAVTFPDSSIQNTSAIVSGKVPFSVLPAGSVLQVVNATYNIEVTSSSSTYADTGLTASITPKFSTSKILVIVNQNGCFKQTSDTFLRLKLFRGGTELSQFEGVAGYNNGNGENNIGSCSTCHLDSPATTSSTTYKTQFNSHNNSAQTGVQRNSSVSTITLMEIAQ